MVFNIPSSRLNCLRQTLELGIWKKSSVIRKVWDMLKSKVNRVLSKVM